MNTRQESAHFTPDEFESFLGEKLESDRKREVLAHLLAECSVCQEIAQRFWSTPTADRPRSQACNVADVERSVQSAIDRAEERYRRLAGERGEAPVLLEELLSHPPLRRQMLIRHRRRYQTWALCELLVDRAHANRFDDPRQYEELAETARCIAFTLDPEVYGAELVCDMRGRTLAYLANAKRVHTSDLPQVETLLQQAAAELANGTGDPLELFAVLAFERALRMRQRMFEEALALCIRQQALAERVNDRKLIGKTQQDTGFALRSLGRFEEALHAFLRAEESLDPVDDARSLSAVRFNRIGTLDDLGRRAEALEEMEPLRGLLAELGDRLNLLRLRRMEGEFALSLDQYELAEACFRESRNGFIALDIGWEAAEVSLYLAQVLLLTGRIHESKELAEQILPIFRSASLTTEAIAAILLFREALLTESASVQLIQRTLEFLSDEQQRKSAQRG
ncbi:MAG TPA: hypothetical protein VMT85_01070 [Thermoanaerobaculia bacterium]|nr:hypothetical protein [Thermoanaerobaculia bacterium]